MYYFELQLATKYFKTFSPSTIVSLHCKWNETGLNARQLQTLDLKKEILGNLKIECRNLASNLYWNYEAILLENWTKSAIKISTKILTYSILKITLKIFCEGFRKQNSPSNLVQTPWKLNFLQILVKPFTLFKLIFKTNNMRQIAILEIFQKVLFHTLCSRMNLVLSASKTGLSVFVRRFHISFSKKYYFCAFHAFLN